MSFPARLYDGASAVPRRGTAQVRDDTLVFLGEDGRRQEWNVAQPLSIHRVADEVHVELAAPDGGPAAKLVAGDPEFEDQLDEALSRFGTTLASRGLLRRTSLRTWLLVAAIVLPAAYSTVTILAPKAHVLIPESVEIELGEKLYAAIADRWQVVEDEEFSELCETIVAELADPESSYPIRVTLLDEDLPNAFAVPGGRVVVFRGLLRLCPSADALAGVLAHEIVHVEERHGLEHLLRTFGVLYFASCAIGGGVEEFATAETVAELASGLLVLEHSRDHEREADLLGARELHRTGHTVAGMVEFFRVLEGEHPESASKALAWARTHPLTAERRKVLALVEQEEDFEARPWLAPERWLDLRERLAPDSSGR